MRSAKFVPSTIYGTFKVMNLKATNQSKIPSFKSTRKFVGAFADKNRVLSEEEKGLVPQIGDDYILPKEVVSVCHLIAETRGSKRPMTRLSVRLQVRVLLPPVWVCRTPSLPAMQALRCTTSLAT